MIISSISKSRMVSEFMVALLDCLFANSSLKVI